MYGIKVFKLEGLGANAYVAVSRGGEAFQVIGPMSYDEAVQLQVQLAAFYALPVR